MQEYSLYLWEDEEYVKRKSKSILCFVIVRGRHNCTNRISTLRTEHGEREKTTERGSVGRMCKSQQLRFSLSFLFYVFFYYPYIQAAMQWNGQHFEYRIWIEPQVIVFILQCTDIQVNEFSTYSNTPVVIVIKRAFLFKGKNVFDYSVQTFRCGFLSRDGSHNK